MDSTEWSRVEALFHAALEHCPAERPAFLSAAAGEDSRLAAAVTALLREDDAASPLDNKLNNLNLEQLARSFVDERTPETDLPNLAFGPYRVLRFLGEGGMGVVYLAQRDDLGSQAAIKLLRHAWMSPARRARFAAEQRLLAQLNHPAIARLYDADTLPDGTPWFAMEYVEGVPLTDYCRSQSSSIAERLRLLRAVAEAVRYAHSRAVIHRDLKPSNILVQSNGLVKLLDFGIAKQLDQPDEPANETRTGLRLMTPAYAAPEQLRGEPVGTYTDVYALGVILYELLAGQLPFAFSTRSPREAEAAILQREPAKPSSGARLSGISSLSRKSASWADLDVLCLTAMHEDPERRYRSVDGLIGDIDHYLAAEPLDARADTLGYRLGKFLQRNRRAVISAALLLASVASLAVFYTARLTAARNNALAQSARTARVLRFTLDLFNGGDKEAGPASNLRASTLVDRGAAEAASLLRDPDVQSELQETLGEVYQKLGNFDRANALLTSAWQTRRIIYGPKSASAASTLLKLGLLRLEQANLMEAERLVRQALTACQQTVRAGDPAIAAATHALGKVLEERGFYNQAIETLTEAIRLRSNSQADSADLAASRMELANTYYYSGRLAEAEALYRELLVIHRQLYGEHHPLIAEDLGDLGAIRQQLGQYGEAEALHRQALTIVQAFYGPEHNRTAVSLTQVARALIMQERYSEASTLLNQALAIREKTFGNIHPLVASTLSESGNLALAQDHFQDAEAIFRRVLSIYQTVYAGKHFTVGITLGNMGSVYLAQKQYSRAEPLFRAALKMYAQTLPPGSLDESITRIKLGRVLLRQRRFSEAEKETLTGYRILSKQTSPSTSWLTAARKDLAAIYSALGEPAQAREFTPGQR